MPGPPSARFIFFSGSDLFLLIVPFFSSCQINQDVLSLKHAFSMERVCSVVHRSTLEREKLLDAAKGNGEMVEGDAKF